MNPLSIVILSRSTRVVGALCILTWLLVGGTRLSTDPNFANLSIGDMIQYIAPSAALYLVPGIILFLLGLMVKAGRLWAAPLIFVISILSLFKLVLLLVPHSNPLLKAPLYFELPVRIACAMLSILCVFAWEDLSEAHRTRPRKNAGPLVTSQQGNGLPRIPRPIPRPPPPSKVLRQKVRPEEPPASQTPWS